MKRREEVARLVEDVADELVRHEVVRAVKRRRVAEAAFAALITDIVKAAVQERLPGLEEQLRVGDDYGKWERQCSMSWAARVDSQPLQAADEAALAALGWDHRGASDLTQIAAESKVKKADVHTLSHSQWLNDNIINTYLALLVQRGQNVPELPSVHAMSSHFFAKLQATACDYAALKRWTKNVDVFNFDVLLVPVHAGKHWTLGVVDFASRTVAHYDSRGKRSEAAVALLREWLGEEWRNRKPDEPANDFATFATYLPGPDAPQQISNNNDCGVFLCAIANCVTARRPLAFAQEHIRYIRARMTFELLLGKIASPM